MTENAFCFLTNITIFLMKRVLIYYFSLSQIHHGVTAFSQQFLSAFNHLWWIFLLQFKIMVILRLMCVPDNTESKVKINTFHIVILPRALYCIVRLLCVFFEWRSRCPTSPNLALYQPSTRQASNYNPRWRHRKTWFSRRAFRFKKTLALQSKSGVIHPKQALASLYGAANLEFAIIMI